MQLITRQVPPALVAAFSLLASSGVGQGFGPAPVCYAVSYDSIQSGFERQELAFTLKVSSRRDGRPRHNRGYDARVADRDGRFLVARRSGLFVCAPQQWTIRTVDAPCAERGQSTGLGRVPDRRRATGATSCSNGGGSSNVQGAIGVLLPNKRLKLAARVGY